MTVDTDGSVRFLNTIVCLSPAIVGVHPLNEGLTAVHFVKSVFDDLYNLNVSWAVTLQLLNPRQPILLGRESLATLHPQYLLWNVLEDDAVRQQANDPRPVEAIVGFGDLSAELYGFEDLELPSETYFYLPDHCASRRIEYIGLPGLYDRRWGEYSFVDDTKDLIREGLRPKTFVSPKVFSTFDIKKI